MGMHIHVQVQKILSNMLYVRHEFTVTNFKGMMWMLSTSYL